MARRGKPRRKRVELPVPPALPPETRTVGQLVAESIRLYGASFWRSLALGVPVAVAGVVAVEPAVLLIAFLNVLGLLPAAAWLGFVGLVVPVAILEDRVSFRRALELSRADLAHAIGSLATLTLVALLTAYTIFFTLRSAGTAALRASAFMSVLVISPLLFLGGALLYFDQSARVGSAPRTRRRDADVHPAVQPDRAGRPDA